MFITTKNYLFYCAHFLCFMVLIKSEIYFSLILKLDLGDRYCCTTSLSGTSVLYKVDKHTGSQFYYVLYHEIKAVSMEICYTPSILLL